MPRTSPPYPRPRSAPPKRFSLRFKMRMTLLSTTMISLILLRLYHGPFQAWLQGAGLPGRLLVVSVLLSPTLGVLIWHRYKHRDL